MNDKVGYLGQEATVNSFKALWQHSSVEDGVNQEISIAGSPHAIRNSCRSNVGETPY